MNKPNPKRPILTVQRAETNASKLTKMQPAAPQSPSESEPFTRNTSDRDTRDMRAKTAERDTILTDLQTEFAAFFDPRNPQPLAVGAFEVLAQRLCPKTNRSAVRHALRYWTGSLRYHMAVVAKDAVRIHPEAAASPEPVSDEHRRYALERIDQIKAARVKPRKGKRQ
jgi:sRNA-binding protein